MRKLRTLRFLAASGVATFALVACGNRDHFVAPIDNTTTGAISLAGTIRSATSADLTWTLPQGVDAEGGARVYRNGEVIGRATGSGWTDLSLQPQTDYTYRVFALDSHGDEHSESNAVVIRTPAMIVPKVYVSPDTTSLSIADSIQFVATVRDSATGLALSGYPITWSTTNTNVAVITSSGVSRATGSGASEIVAMSGSLSGKALLHVASPPPPDTIASTLTIVPGALTMEPTDQSQLQAVLRTASGIVLTGRVVTWTSSNDSAAIVTSTGRVIAMASGGAVITGRSGLLTGTASVIVHTPAPPGRAPVATLTVAPGSASREIGTTAQFTATVKDTGNVIVTDRTIIWTSSNATVAQVTSTGLVTALSVGSTTITATSEGKSGQATMTVTIPPPPAVASITVSPPSSTMTPGGTVQLTATTLGAQGQVLANRPITWSVVGSGTATVSTSGVVTAVAPGTVQVQAASEGHSAAATITVTTSPPIAIASLTVTPPTASVTVGGTSQLVATPKDGAGNVLTGRTVVWSSSATSIATVSTTGVVSTIATGSATITATSEGISGTASITVTAAAPDPVATLSVSPSPLQVFVQSTGQLTATTKSAQGATLTGRVVTWSSNNNAVATVSSTGVVTGVTPGTATVLATSEGVQATVTVTVAPKPVITVTLNPGTPILCVASALQLVAIPRDADGNVLTGRVVVWSVNNGAIASVSSSGLLLGLSLGSVTVTATVEGVSAQVTLSLCLPLVATVEVTSPLSILGLLGLPIQLGTIARDALGNVITGRAVTWSVTPANRALLSLNGLLTPLALGNVTVTAQIEGAQGTKVLGIQLF